MSQSFRFNCIKVSPVLFFLLFFQFVNAQQNFPDLDAKLQQYKQQLGNKFVALVYKDGKIVYSKTQGDVTPTSVAPIASCSKWLTAALVMTFVDEGKLSLDDKVSTYLPIFATYGKSYITIRQCLSNFTGIQGDDGSEMGSGGTVTLQHEVEAYASRHEIQTNPGTAFRYSNIGFNIAGAVLEIVSKKSFEQLMQARILKPLGMKATTFQGDYDNTVSPASGATSTANDFTNFLAMILDKGMFKGKRVLSENAIKQMEQAQTTPDIIKYTPKAAAGFAYGFGNWIFEQDASGNATTVGCPGLHGVWPVVDYCRGYTFLLFAKTPDVDQNKEIYFDIKKTIDNVYTCNQ